MEQPHRPGLAAAADRTVAAVRLDQERAADPGGGQPASNSADVLASRLWDMLTLCTFSIHT
jgi:hypothetical protein